MGGRQLGRTRGRGEAMGRGGGGARGWMRWASKSVGGEVGKGEERKRETDGETGEAEREREREREYYSTTSSARSLSEKVPRSVWLHCRPGPGVKDPRARRHSQGLFTLCPRLAGGVWTAEFSARNGPTGPAQASSSDCTRSPCRCPCGTRAGWWSGCTC